MDHPAIFSATLGLSHPWQVTAVTIVKEEGRLDITVAYAAGSLPCPECGRHRPCHVSESETWEHGDFFSYQTFLHARVPRAERCSCGNDAPIGRPWCRGGSKFVLVEDEGGIAQEPRRGREKVECGGKEGVSPGH